MLKLYFQNYSKNFGVSIHKPLPCSLEQTIDLFENLPQNDGSYFGLISENEVTIQFSKYNKFVWLIEIPIQKKKGTYQIFFTPHKCRALLSDLYKGIDPLKINGLLFEKNK